MDFCLPFESRDNTPAAFEILDNACHLISLFFLTESLNLTWLYDLVNKGKKAAEHV